MTSFSLRYYSNLSSRAERPGFFCHAVVWRAGSRSRGIPLRSILEVVP